MDDLNLLNSDPRVFEELESRREWMVATMGGSLCYALILWLC